MLGPAISIGIEGVKNPTGALIVRDNVFHSDVGGRTIFVRNSSDARVELSGNAITGDVQVEGDQAPNQR